MKSGALKKRTHAPPPLFFSHVCMLALFFLFQATDAFSSPLEKARCLSLLANLAFDSRCARTLFQGGAVPQMLLSAQGCTHDELIDVHSGGSGGGGSDGRASPALSATSCESEGRPRTGTATEELEAGSDEERQQNPSPPPPTTAAGGDASGVACCRCRQAMRLLARLVRGLPGETPAVVVRHSGLRSIVKILEDGAAEAAALASAHRDGASRRLPAATEAAVREALEVRDAKGLLLLLGFFYGRGCLVLPMNCSRHTP